MAVEDEKYDRIVIRVIAKCSYNNYGLVTGGDFEAEALCLHGVWEDCSENYRLIYRLQFR